MGPIVCPRYSRSNIRKRNDATKGRESFSRSGIQPVRLFLHLRAIEAIRRRQLRLRLGRRNGWGQRMKEVILGWRKAGLLKDGVAALHRYARKTLTLGYGI